MIIILVVFGTSSLTAGDAPRNIGAGATPFTWNQNEVWRKLEMEFRDVRSAGCAGVGPEIEKRFQKGKRQLAILASPQSKPADLSLNAVEENLFGLGPLMAACPQRIGEYADLIMSVRNVIKRRSIAWDLGDEGVHDILYRILYGGRIALEEVMLQAPEHSLPAILPGLDEPSKTPSFRYAGIEFHSGDILVSRGGAPTSALIARGNDHPGNFSHIALLYVDETTNIPSIIEAHIERGVVISTPDEYFKDVKLRVMCLRVRADHPLLQKDPMLPHKAAKKAYEETGKKHIPYDFAMDFKDPSQQFCSEVAYQAYVPLGISLWTVMTTMSSPGVVSWLGDFGVKNFVTQAPADLEYDPQLSVVAEARDTGALFQAHVDDAVIDAMLEGADRGDRFEIPWYLLISAGFAKTYSVVLNFFGKIGPVPEGMSVAAAVKAMELEKKHKRLKTEVLSATAVFAKENGYRPPYWELVRMAKRANENN
ncbi:MAG: YiiX/YebB-like N1pC/P60 family cysteine hydrolase [Syntrophorhabdaceae bacterium]